MSDTDRPTDNGEQDLDEHGRSPTWERAQPAPRRGRHGAGL